MLTHNTNKGDTMARQGVTFEQIAAAAAAIAADGGKPTIEAVRKALGTGSPNTIHKGLAEWRRQQQATAPQAAALDDRHLAAIAAELEKAKAEATAALAEKLEQAEAAAAELAAAGEAAEQEAERLRARAAQAEAIQAEMETRAKMAEEAARQLQTELGAERDAGRMSAAEIGELRGQLGALQDLVKKLEAERDKNQGEKSNLLRELGEASAKAETERARAERAELRAAEAERENRSQLLKRAEAAEAALPSPRPASQEKAQPKHKNGRQRAD